MGSYLQIGGPLPRCSAGRRAEAWKRAGKRLTELKRAREPEEMSAGQQGGGTGAERWRTLEQAPDLLKCPRALKTARPGWVQGWCSAAELDP